MAASTIKIMPRSINLFGNGLSYLSFLFFSTEILPKNRDTVCSFLYGVFAYYFNER